MRRTLLTTALILMVTGSAASPAGATFPGPNGPIAYRHFEPATGNFPLLRAQPDGTDVRQLTDLPGFFSDWRADGRRIAFDFFDANGDQQIATMNADGGDLRVITSGPGIHEVPSWSPDGSTIVFDFSPDNPEAPGFETRLWTMDADGSDARPLPMRRDGFDVEPRYSPNGRLIAFDRLHILGNGEQRQAVFVVDTEDGRVRQLTRWQLNAEHPTWSPDGRWILYNLGPDGTIEAIRPDGRDRRTILPASPGFGAHKPWSSPDGSKILFMCETQGTLPDPPADHTEDICVMDADGSDIVNLTNTPGIFENFPSWGPAP